jgi:hypothetical protein
MPDAKGSFFYPFVFAKIHLVSLGIRADVHPAMVNKM